MKCQSQDFADPLDLLVPMQYLVGIPFWGLIYFLALNERGRARALLRSSAELGFSLNLTPEVSKALVK